MSVLSRLVFCAAMSYFLVRGPWRATATLNSYDFASVYGASRSWMHGQDPYDMDLLQREVAAAGDRPPLPHSYPPPCIYFPTALPVFAAAVGWLSWVPARMVWCLLSVAVFGCSLLLIFSNANLSTNWKWLLAAAILLFSPTTSGLSTGNPSVLTCGLTVLAIYFALQRRTVWCALALGVAHCLKPQISICAVALFALWSYWKPLFLSFCLPIVSAAVSVLPAGSIAVYRTWLMSLHRVIESTLAAGSLNDPRPSNPFSHQTIGSEAIFGVFLPNLRIDSTLALMLALALIGFYLWFRRGSTGNRQCQDMAFFSAVTLTPVYHRYYDAQLLLLAVPFLVQSFAQRSGRKRDWRDIGILCCLVLLAFPSQALAAGWAAAPRVDQSVLGFLLFRHQPLAIVAVCVLLLRPKRTSTAMP